MVNQSVITSMNIVGNVISLGVFLSPIPILYGIRKKKAVEEFKPDPYLSALLTCAVWVFYGMPFVRDSLLDVTINAVGLVFEIVYLAIFYIYSNKKGRKKLGICLLIEAVFFAAIVLITLLAIDSSERTLSVYGICNILNVVVSVAPLTIMVRVRKTKSVKYMPFWLSLTRFLYGVSWTTYTFLFPPLDIFVLFCNGIGVILGAVQLILYGYYWYKGENQID